MKRALHAPSPVAIDATSSEEPILVMTRLLDAPRDVVWSAFTDPRHVSRWFGGHGFVNVVCEMDVRPGGLWRQVMRLPDGSELAMEVVFIDVVAPERLAWQHVDQASDRRANTRRAS